MPRPDCFDRVSRSAPEHDDSVRAKAGGPEFQVPDIDVAAQIGGFHFGPDADDFVSASGGGLGFDAF